MRGLTGRQSPFVQLNHPVARGPAAIDTFRALTVRQLQPEVMDQPDLDPTLHQQALQGLARINWWSGSARIFWSGIRRALPAKPAQPLRILDLACGGGDVTIGLWRRAVRAGYDVQVVGCDRSAWAVRQARSRAAATAAAVEFIEADVLEDELPGPFDVVVSSLFLHHLDEAQAERFLARMAATTQRLVLVNDLVRNRPAWLLAQAASRMLTSSSVVHIDGPRSVAGAFNLAEMRRIVERAGLSGATLHRRWPFRFLLTWQKTS